MVDETNLLDAHRGMAAQTATELRRLNAAVQRDQANLRAKQAELEGHLLAAPSKDWPEAAERARYLLGLFADTPAAADPRRQQLIKALLDDFDRLAALPAHDNDDHPKA